MEMPCTTVRDASYGGMESIPTSVARHLHEYKETCVYNAHSDLMYILAGLFCDEYFFIKKFGIIRINT